MKCKLKDVLIDLEEDRQNKFLPSILSEVSSLFKEQAKKQGKLSVLE